jgi:hypothetical protein
MCLRQVSINRTTALHKNQGTSLYKPRDIENENVCLYNVLNSVTLLEILKILTILPIVSLHLN